MCIVLCNVLKLAVYNVSKLAVVHRRTVHYLSRCRLGLCLSSTDCAQQTVLVPSCLLSASQSHVLPLLQVVGGTGTTTTTTGTISGSQRSGRSSGADGRSSRAAGGKLAGMRDSKTPSQQATLKTQRSTPAAQAPAGPEEEDQDQDQDQAIQDVEMPDQQEQAAASQGTSAAAKRGERLDVWAPNWMGW